MGRPGQAPAESGYEIDPDGPLHSRVADEEVAHIKSSSQFGGRKSIVGVEDRVAIGSQGLDYHTYHSEVFVGDDDAARRERPGLVGTHW